MAGGRACPVVASHCRARYRKPDEIGPPADSMRWEELPAIPRKIRYSTASLEGSVNILKSLSIKAFRNLDTVNMPELGQVNIVIGTNSVGKTALLEAVSLVCHAGAKQVAALISRRHENALATPPGVPPWRNLFPRMLPKTNVEVRARLEDSRTEWGVRLSENRPDHQLRFGRSLPHPYARPNIVEAMPVEALLEISVDIPAKAGPTHSGSNRIALVAGTLIPGGRPAFATASVTGGALGLVWRQFRRLQRLKRYS